MLVLMMLAAFLYSSVGHGGASSYLTLMTLFNYLPEEIKPTALILNMFVSGISFWSFRKVCVFPIKLFLQLVVFSMPLAFIGGSIDLDPLWYKRILAVVLLFAIFRLLSNSSIKSENSISQNFILVASIGATIGFVSGLIGIGGGILLSPILLFLGWTNIKETSAVSALFIFLNSLAGLMGSQANIMELSTDSYILLPCTLIAGIIGSRLAANYFNTKVLRYFLATVLLIASIKFLILS